jgi:hypothetical protein
VTDRHSAYIVILKDDIREDDAEPTINALRMIQGVASVEPVVATYEQMVAYGRANHEWHMRILQMLKDTRHAPTDKQGA